MLPYLVIFAIQQHRDSKSCARRRRFLLTIRDRDDFARKTCFSLRKRFRFEMKSAAPEIDDFAILSLARLPISPPFAG